MRAPFPVDIEGASNLEVLRVDNNFFEDFLGMRCENVDMSEISRRIENNIYDPEEFEKAIAWTKENCKEGKDYNPDTDKHDQDHYMNCFLKFFWMI